MRDNFLFFPISFRIEFSVLVSENLVARLIFSTIFMNSLY